MTRETFLDQGQVQESRNTGSAAAGREEDELNRDYFTPLWRTKHVQSFGGGLLGGYHRDRNGGDVMLSTAVESEGFFPLRKVRGNSERQGCRPLFFCFLYLSPPGTGEETCFCPLFCVRQHFFRFFLLFPVSLRNADTAFNSPVRNKHSNSLPMLTLGS